MNARPVFGVTEPPKETGERMAYIARAACGHIVIVQTDSRASSLTDFVAEGLMGLTLERVTLEAFKAEGLCTCPKPEQMAADL